MVKVEEYKEQDDYGSPRDEDPLESSLPQQVINT